MDPQDRLFLETTHACIEDAGIAPESLQRCKVGVYAGSMYGDYQLFGVEETLRGNPMALFSFHASVSNRVSHALDLTGPSMTLDTICSSSLTALHLACRAIEGGECTLAIAGGVNLTLHQNKYLMLSQGRFLSTDGRCRSFGAISVAVHSAMVLRDGVLARLSDDDLLAAFDVKAKGSLALVRALRSHPLVIDWGCWGPWPPAPNTP